MSTLVDRVLTVGEVRAWQGATAWLTGMQGFWQFGWNGTTNVPDLSGNANTGTITGATVSPHVPLGNWNGARGARLPYVVAAAAPAASSGWPDRRRRGAVVYRHLLQG